MGDGFEITEGEIALVWRLVEAQLPTSKYGVQETYLQTLHQYVRLRRMRNIGSDTLGGTLELLTERGAVGPMKFTPA